MPDIQAKSFFVTGTDTEIGKTWVTCGLLRAATRAGLRAVGMKPIAAGGQVNPDGSINNEDVREHLIAGNVAAPQHYRNPYAFALSVSPHIAARAAGVSIDFARLREAHAGLRALADLVLVEGAGGWLSPVDDTRTMQDLAVVLNLPVILVIGIRLGCLNHAALTLQAIQASGLRCAGWIANCMEPAMPALQDNIDYLREHLDVSFLGTLPYLASQEKIDLNQAPILDAALQALLAG